MLPRPRSESIERSRARVLARIPHLEGTAAPDLPEELRAAMLAPALAHRAEPLPVPLLHQFARYWRDGDRMDYEDDARALSVRTCEAVLAAVATGEHAWLDRAADGLMLLCEMSTWCWVAHEEAHRRRGWVLPDPDAPVLDLGAAQVAETVVWADLALGTALDERVPGLRERLRRELRIRVIEPYLRREDWFWLHGRAHNWTGWIHQHLIAATLLMVEDPRERERILERAHAQLERYLASFPADGGIDEGFSYFWNGASRLLESLDLLELPGEGAEVPAVLRELIRFPQRMDLGDGWFVNAADGPARPRSPQPWHVLHRWGLRLGDADVVREARVHRGPGPLPPVLPELGLGRVLQALGDPDWLAAEAPAAAGTADVGAGPGPLPVESWLPELEVLVARERAGDPRGLALAVKGGHNAEAHNHLDVGSCIVAADSSPVLVDLGQPTYTAATFSEDRYAIWVMQSSWHTLPRIGGHEQGVGPEHRARAVQAQLLGGPGGADAAAPAGGTSALSLDIAGAYPQQAGLVSYRRTAGLERGADPCVRIHDQWRPAPGREAIEVALHHVIAGDVLDLRPGRLSVRALSGALVDLEWDAAALGDGQLERREIDDPLLQASWGTAVHRLVLRPDAAVRSAEVLLRIVGR